MGLRLLVLAFGLPLCSLIFLAAPALLACLGVSLLYWGGVRFEPWSEVTRWLAIGLNSSVVAVIVFVYASQPHTAHPDRRRFGLSSWLLLGGLLGAAWVICLLLEFIPKSTLAPTLHYALLVAVVTWSAWTLAWATGRGVGKLVARAQARAFASETTRGAIMAGGPSLALGVIGISSVFFASELPKQVGNSLDREVTLALDDARTLVPRQRDPRPDPEPEARRITPDECFEAIYRGRRPGRLWDKAVVAARKQAARDPENVASEAAMAVCAKPRVVQDLGNYYLRAVRSRAGKSLRRELRLDRCEVGWQDQRTPLDEEECIAELICRLAEPEQTVARLHLVDGLTDPELAHALTLTVAAATKRRQRVIAQLSASAQLQCR